MSKIITLSNLPEATAQEVFDQVANHLYAQGKQSLENSGATCLYRNPEGLKCAAGCLMSDEEYEDIFDLNGDWQSLVELNYVPSNHQELIKELQMAHDVDIKWEADLWVNSLNQNLAEIANSFNLTFTPFPPKDNNIQPQA